MQQFDFSADQPARTRADDYFQRYGFAARIAQVITTRQQSSSLAIGVYGSWGEGKTSVMQFIERELSAHSDAIVVQFNPWRFADEPSLLRAFFTTLADHLKPLSPERRWFKTRKESLGELLSKYAGYAAVLKATPVGGLADVLPGLGKTLADVPLETLKARIEALLQGARRKIVVIIDDIDRLEKTEIHAVFRLVKLTADFPYTTYLLCFDDRIVASSIGERFADGSQQSGYEFLEKVIHVPLRIPAATKRDLRDYLFTFLREAVQVAGGQVPIPDLEKFEQSFSQHFLPQYTTPRLAKRLLNSISFVLPLLQHEINYHDLLFIEAVKIFYPAIYALIREHRGYFLGSFEVRDRSAQDEKERHTAFFNRQLGSHPPERQAMVKGLLAAIFPKLDELWGKGFLCPEAEELFAGKHLASPYYFDRYFSYTVLKGEVPDVVYDAFFRALTDDGPQAEALWQQLLAAANLWEVHLRFHFWRSRFTSGQASGLITLLTAHEAEITAKLQQAEWFDRHFDTAGLIASLLTFRVEPVRQEAVLAAVFAAPVSFDLLHHLTLELWRPHRRGEPVSDTLRTLAGASLLRRALQEAGTASLLTVHQAATHFLFRIWVNVRDPASLQAYLQQHITNPEGVLQLVQAFTPPVTSSAYPGGPYRSNFGPQEFDALRTLLDPRPLMALLPLADQVAEAEFPSAGHWEPADDELLLRQFVYWCHHPLPEAAC